MTTSVLANSTPMLTSFANAHFIQQTALKCTLKYLRRQQSKVIRTWIFYQHAHGPEKTLIYHRLADLLCQKVKKRAAARNRNKHLVWSLRSGLLSRQELCHAALQSAHGLLWLQPPERGQRGARQGHVLVPRPSHCHSPQPAPPFLPGSPVTSLTASLGADTRSKEVESRPDNGTRLKKPQKTPAPASGCQRQHLDPLNPSHGFDFLRFTCEIKCSISCIRYGVEEQTTILSSENLAHTDISTEVCLPSARGCLPCKTMGLPKAPCTAGFPRSLLQ